SPLPIVRRQREVISPPHVQSHSPSARCTIAARVLKNVQKKTSLRLQVPNPPSRDLGFFGFAARSRASLQPFHAVFSSLQYLSAWRCILLWPQPNRPPTNQFAPSRVFDDSPMSAR